MAEISNVKNALQTVVKKDRFLNAIFAGGKSLVTAVGRTFYAFWLQATGLVYLVLTVTGASSLVYWYKKDHFADRGRLWISIIGTLVCGFFTLQSFLKAKRTVKSK